MRRIAAAALLVALAGCDRSPAPEATPANPEPMAQPKVREAPARAIGRISGLTGQTSGLSGTISDFLVERTATETRVQLAADTLFDFDKATLSPAAQANLQRTADLVRQGGKGKVTVIGHTDAKGDDAYNLDLSKRRAEAVVAWLRGQSDMAAHELEAIGRGEAEPIAPNARPDGNDDPDGRARNRRVVVTIPL